MERRGLLLFSLLLVIIKDAIATCNNFSDSDVLKPRIMLDSNGWTMAHLAMPFTCPGYIKTWKWFPSVSTSFLGLVWRPTGTTSEYEVVGRTLIPAVADTDQIYSYNLDISEWIPVEAGDVIGFKFDQAVIKYTYNESSRIVYANSISIEDLVVSSRHTLASVTGYRSYSIMAIHEEFVDTRFVIETKCSRSSTMRKVKTGLRLFGHVIETLNRLTLTACVASCQVQRLCMSITYDEENKLCDLNNATGKDSSDFSAAASGVAYYEFIEALQYYPTCDASTIYHGDICSKTRVCKCASIDDGNTDCASSENEWNIIFKGVSGTGNSLYEAYVAGTGATGAENAILFSSNQNFRFHQVFTDWTSLQITKVKVTLFSQSSEELMYLIFDGVESSITSWFTLNKLLESPWSDLSTGSSLNYFSINGHSNSRTWFISSYYAGCPGDVGWLAVIDSSLGCAWESGGTPQILYSTSNSLENWTSGSIGSAHLLTVHVKYGD